MGASGGELAERPCASENGQSRRGAGAQVEGGERPMMPGLAADAGVRDALQLNPTTGAILSAYHEALLRGPSPIPVADRELIAAFVSGLNQCLYCHNTHKAAAVAFGISPDLIADLVKDPDLGAASPRMRPLLAFAHKLTLAQKALDPADFEAVFAAGWNERALHDAICIACTFNFMNRFVHGHGIEGHPTLWAERGQHLHDFGYGGLVGAADEHQSGRG